MRECVAALIATEKKVLLGRRSAAREFYPDIWDFFGGHLLRGELPEEALRRELMEELGIIPTRWEFLLTAENDEGCYHVYLVTNWTGAPRNLQPEEHALIKWFDFEKALKLPFAHPIYIELIKKATALNRRS